jgi:hypothetical protein
MDLENYANLVIDFYPEGSQIGQNYNLTGT